MKLIICIFLISVFSIARAQENQPADTVPGKPMLLIINNDSLKHPADSFYTSKWDTMYIRVTRRDYSFVKDTVYLPISADSHSDLCMPVPGKLISDFGYRGSRVHAGVDLKLAKGDSVYCAFDGEVRISRYFSGYGNIVVVRHYNGLETAYAHLTKRVAMVGDKVKAGDLMGLGGRTGRATCDHLHFEIRFLEEPIDPKLVIDWTEKKLVCDTLCITEKTFKYAKPSGLNKNHQNNNLIAGTPSQNVYVIRQGDTLYAIARHHNTTVAKLCALNNLSETSVLHIGQKIKLK
jgi:hypothetical protein